MNSFAATPSAFSLEDDSISRFSSSVGDSHIRDCSFIDLNLGRFGNLKAARNSRTLKGTAIASPSVSSMPLEPPKKARIGINPQTAYCQVYGCNKDLSSSKEYHKRHKVCETHTKTAKVIVSGIEQRFCQQCSRFHLLAEFDNGKRSCRKRLAGHNERRRKPQVGSHSGKTGRLLHSNNGFAGGKFHRTALTASSFICQELLPGGLLHPEKNGTNDWCQGIKVENGIDFSSPSAITVTNEHLRSKSLFPPNKLDKFFRTFDDNIANTAAGSIFSENTNHCPQYFGGQNSFSNPLVQSSSLGNEDLSGFDAASAIHGFSGIVESGCALSLLSSQSRKSSGHSSVVFTKDQILLMQRVIFTVKMVPPLTCSSYHHSFGEWSIKGNPCMQSRKMLLAGLTSIKCSWKTPKAGARACGCSIGIHTGSFQAT